MLVFWLVVLLLFWLVSGLLAAGHALLTHPDPRAAWGWIAVCILLPVLGAPLYVMLGVNRIQRRARRFAEVPGRAADGQVHAAPLDAVPTAFRALAQTGSAVLGAPLLQGNAVAPLHNGEQAYPRMLQAIDSAQQSVALSTFIFENNETGRQFVEALSRAQARGVDVRLLVDAVGDLYFFPRMTRLLRETRLRFRPFNPPGFLPPAMHVNLRNHRKLLIVDQALAYTGGMNIGGRHLVRSSDDPLRVQDVHFELRGPIVGALASVFEDDWRFATGESRPAPVWQGETAGDALCRAIPDGPNERYERLSMLLQAAVAAAQDEVRIMTPYFLPTAELSAALQGAAVRGVRVDVVIPEINDHYYVQAASRHMLRKLLPSGIRAWYQPPPFAHSKLFLVDRRYLVFGSSNMDPRSLRLNFELCVECFGGDLPLAMAQHFDTVLAASSEITLDRLKQRDLGESLRDALYWLFSPYY